MRRKDSVIDFLGIKINNLTKNEILNHIDKCIIRKIPCHMVGVNVDQALRVLENKYSEEIFKNAEIVFTDGKPIIWMAKGLRRPIVEKVSGPDLLYAICRRAVSKKYKVFLLGANPGVADKAALKLQKNYPQIQIAGTYSPHIGFEKDIKELKNINNLLLQSKADILFVGLGSPKQDVFIYENMDKYQIPVSISIGAAIDFVSGNVKRAPKWMQSMGFEWFFRFLQNPKRLFKRYFIEDIRFIKYYISYRNKEKIAGKF